jgi:UDP-N-acetylglucosamine 4,6-dehydratase
MRNRTSTCPRTAEPGFIKTNAPGIWNVLDACIGEGVKKVAALPTHETSSAIIVYGATRSSADNLFVAANNHAQTQETWLPVLKHGNVMGSRDSFLPLFEGKIAASGARADQRLAQPFR